MSLDRAYGLVLVALFVFFVGMVAGEVGTQHPAYTTTWEHVYTGAFLGVWLFMAGWMCAQKKEDGQ